LSDRLVREEIQDGDAATGDHPPPATRGRSRAKCYGVGRLTSRAARIDDYSNLEGEIARTAP
jgi:hypothetical protein